MKTTYKGFTIEQNDRTEVALGADPVRFYVHPIGNPAGYATLNNAKGAITKHLQALPAAQVEQTPAVAPPLPAQADTIRYGDVNYLNAPASGPTVKNGWLFGVMNLKGDPIHADPQTANLYAQLDYYGMTKETDTRSRIKREGLAVVRRFAKAIESWPKNRKQRKQDKMLRRYLQIA